MEMLEKSRKPTEWSMTDEDSKRTMNVESTLVQFCSSTTAHGFSYLTKASLLGKIFWVCVLIFSLTGVCIHLYLTVSSYLEYKYTDMSVVSDSPPKFPDVTIWGHWNRNKPIIYHSCFISTHN